MTAPSEPRVIVLRMRGPIRSWLWLRWHRIAHREMYRPWVYDHAEFEARKAAIVAALEGSDDGARS